MITHEGALKALCTEIRDTGWFGIDMEFAGERSYAPKLQLVQVSVGETLEIIDPLEIEDLLPLYELVADPSVETVVHAGSHDMAIAYRASGLLPKNIFDIQIAAGLVGYGHQPGYGRLTDALLKVRLSKLETSTDWSRRPLTQSQLDYALDDVRYLAPLRAKLGNRLERLGRTEWAVEEMSHYAEERTYVRDPNRLYMRISRARSLSRKAMAVLRALAIWRDAEAQRRDIPIGRVISDEILLDIAKRQPKAPSELEVLRGLHPNEVRRSGEAICETVASALALPEDQWPEPPPVRMEDPDQSVTVDLMSVLLRARARNAHIAPAYLGTRDDLDRLVTHVKEDNGPVPEILQGWRRELVGEELLALLEGRVGLHIGERSGVVEIGPRDITEGAASASPRPAGVPPAAPSR